MKFSLYVFAFAVLMTHKCAASSGLGAKFRRVLDTLRITEKDNNPESLKNACNLVVHWDVTYATLGEIISNPQNVVCHGAHGETETIRIPRTTLGSLDYNKFYGIDQKKSRLEVLKELGENY
jgi:hypothetical protein